MLKNNNQPQKSDAVLGGQNSVPANIAVLGGWLIKNRKNNATNIRA